jgi:deazaflavin-dependent oxidoreductase (nitroreductase family)
MQATKDPRHTKTSTNTNTSANTVRYLAPGWATRRILNPIMSGLVTLGLPVKGARVLRVRGRSSGEWRAVPVNPLTFDGGQFLVAPRGETQWVRNLRAAGGGELRRGRRSQPFTAIELDDADKPAVLRAYLDEWAWEVGTFFDGVGADASDAELARIAADHPVFRITSA